MTRMGQLRHVFSSKLPVRLKLRIYRAAICSLFTYGSEAWTLDERTRATLNGANARCLSRITGRTIHEEASTRTRTFDLVAAIRRTRTRWLGHILRMGPSRMLYRTAIQQYKLGSEGNLFMDVPPHFTLEETIELAQDRTEWKMMMAVCIPQDKVGKTTRPTTRNGPGRWFGHGADAVWISPPPSQPETTTTTQFPATAPQLNPTTTNNDNDTTTTTSTTTPTAATPMPINEALAAAMATGIAELPTTTPSVKLTPSWVRLVKPR